MRTRPVGGLLAAVLTVTLAAGCTGGPTDAPPSSPSTAAATRQNPADVAFAQGMLPHHRQAVAMSALAADRAGSPEVRDLAAGIDRAQGPELDRMTAMLAAWGVREAMPEMSGMPGMLTDDAMRQLAGLSGPAFDDAFLRLMIEHHTGAVQMAATETAQGSDPAALDLARSITATQQEEIGRMRGLLDRP